VRISADFTGSVAETLTISENSVGAVVASCDWTERVADHFGEIDIEKNECAREQEEHENSCSSEVETADSDDDDEPQFLRQHDLLQTLSASDSQLAAKITAVLQDKDPNSTFANTTQSSTDFCIYKENNHACAYPTTNNFAFASYKKTTTTPQLDISASTKLMPRSPGTTTGPT
jgi:hypothetical protein